jgi:transcriptional regulator with XRE-family HTH domain
MMRTLGREIKKVRIDKGWKQKDLRVATGLSQKYLSEIETGRVDPRISIVKRIATALGVSIDRLTREERDSELTPAAVA